MLQLCRSLLLLGSLILFGVGCTLAPTPTPTPTPFPTLPPATPTAAPTLTPTPTPTSAPIDYTGWWDGSANDGALMGAFQFVVENGAVTEIGFDYTLRFGGCTIISALSGTADESFIEGDKIHATMLGDDGRVLTFNGVFSSAKRAEGTLTYKGVWDDCGAFEKSAPWTADRKPIPPTRTPTPFPPTETPTPVPTATATPLPTDSEPAPTRQAGKYETEFPLPGDVREFYRGGVYEGQINFKTALSVSQIVEFYRTALMAMGLKEDLRLTTIDETGFSIVFNGWKPGKWLVIQGVDLGELRNVNLRLENPS
ncbi:MAG: hypothetical protein HDKAJFGB_03834 [Anaerolineae bacterium]|nr:hypothetical protein [Anaerolineae bacterium]